MADEFTLKVDVGADLSRFRADLKAELDTVQRQGATIPVGATTGAAATSVVPPGAATATAPPGAIATAQAVAQQTTQAAAAVAARAGGQSFYGSITGLSPAAAFSMNAAAAAQSAPQPYSMAPGGASPYSLAAPGRPAGTPVWDMIPMAGGGPTPPEPPPGPGSFSDGLSLSRRRGVPYGRGGRLFTGAYIGYAAGRLAMANIEHGQAERLAGGDPTGIINADVQFRQRAAAAIPIAGEAGLALREYFTGEGEALATTQRDTAQQDAIISQMQRAGTLQDRFRVAGGIARTLSTTQQRRLQVEADARTSLRTVADEQAASEAVQNAPLIARRAATEDTYNRRIRELEGKQGFYPALRRGIAEANRDAELRAINQSATDVQQNIRSRFDESRTDIEDIRAAGQREITRGINLAAFVNTGSTAASRLRTAGRPFFGNMAEQYTAMGAEIFNAAPENKAGVAGRGLQEMAESFVDFARDFGHQQRQMTAQQRVSQKLLERDPLGARIAGIEGERDEALTAANQLPWGFRQLRRWAIGRGAEQDIALARQSDADRRELLRGGLEAERDVARLRADRRPGAAAAEGIFRRGELEAKALEKHGDTAEARIRRETTYEELRAFKEEYRKGFRAEEIQGLSRTALGGSSASSEDPTAVLKSIDQKLQQLIDKDTTPRAAA